MNDRLTFEAFYPHPPEKVWRALTDPEILGSWLMATDFQPQVGFRFSMQSRTLRVTGEVLEAIEARRLRYTWDDGEAGSPSLVDWTLEPKDGGTLLRLEHSAVEDPVVLIEANMNWRNVLGGLLPSRLQQPVPIVYVPEEEDEDRPTVLARAGFRQEVLPCR